MLNSSTAGPLLLKSRFPDRCSSGRDSIDATGRTTLFYFLPISLPVIEASLISLISINDLQRRVASFREIQLILGDSRKRVTFCQTWNNLERIVLKTERALL